MLSKRYESTEVDCRTWLHVHSGISSSTSNEFETHQVVEIQIETSTKIYAPFLSDSINVMDHMRILDTEPSSVILSQTCTLKS